MAAQYVRSWQRQPEDAVLIAPAYTFLMRNQPVDHQFWLDVGALGWWERLNQPITHPYVLSRRWEPGHQWTDLDEYFARQEAMAELVIGLVHRCRKQVHLGLSELSESGSDQRGNCCGPCRVCCVCATEQGDASPVRPDAIHTKT